MGTEMVKTNLIELNPNNPRKDLGDLTELTASIAANGIMQNLTIQRDDDHYVVLIGNRRLKCAMNLGIEEVPCAIVDLSPAEQMAMMLEENMQRNDLTLIEQAHGFQMCLDLGMTEDAISKTTGFSKSTIKHRVEMNRLDQNKLQKIKQISLTDLMKLEQIDSIETRNKLLDAIETNDFEWKFCQELRQQKIHQKLDPVIDAIKDWCKPMPKSIKEWNCQTYKSFQKVSDVTKPKASAKKQYYYTINEFDVPPALRIYSFDKDEKDKEKEEDRNKNEEQSLREEASEKLDNEWKKCIELHVNFMANVSDAIIKKNFAYIMMQAMISCMLGVDICLGMNAEEFLKKVDPDYPDLNLYADGSDKDLEKYIKKDPEVKIVKIIYTILEQYDRNPYSLYNGCYDDDTGNDNGETQVMLILTCLGYKLSRNEIQLMDGTSELYRRNI